MGIEWNEWHCSFTHWHWFGRQTSTIWIHLFCFPHWTSIHTRAHKFPSRALNCTGAYSHISSGSSWGLRIPGTDIWSLCFSSWAWRRAVSLSSKNKSVESSPANSLICTRKSLRCSLNAGMSWFKLKRPVTNTFTWASCRCGKAVLSRLATNSCT